MSRKSGRPCAAIGRRSRPGIEGLESRRLLSLDITTIPVSTPGTPAGIVSGPGGQLWFAVSSTITGAGAAIDSIDPTTHVIASHPINAGVSDQIYGITVGGDGNIWFSETFYQNPVFRLGEYDVATGVFSQHPIPTQTSAITSITTGPDGNIWFGEYQADKIGMYDLATATFSEFVVPTIGANLYGMTSTTGPGAAVWFTEGSGIGEIDPTTHAITEYKSPVSGGYGIQRIADGPDGKLWIAGDGPSAYIGSPPFQQPVLTGFLGSFDPTTHAYVIHTDPAYGSYPGSITAGPDGNVWFTESNGSIGEISPTTGAIAETPVPAPGAYLGPIVTGPDAHLWFAEPSPASVGTFDPRPLAGIGGSLSADLAADGSFQGGPLSFRTAYLDLKGTGQLDPADPTSTTGLNGGYSFIGLAPGTYTVRVVTYPGDILTGPAGASRTVTVGAGQVAAPAPFGLVSTAALLPIHPAGSPFGTKPADVPTAEVNGLYSLILGRAADPAGSAAAVAALKAGTPLSTLAANLFRSDEYDAALAASDYRNYLGRAAGPAEVVAVVSALKGGLTAEQLAAGLLSSAEFSLIHASAADFVRAAYGDTVGRAPSSNELTAVENLLAGALSRSGLIASLLGSEEAANRAVTGLYTTFLARAPDQAGFTFWTAGLRAGALLIDEAIDFAGSAEFATRAAGSVG